ncbi:MAG: PIN domain-containing protein [Bifidobacteriaceae bacterium]|jgi:predicted nucleic acid-binding protein|nr:PIN domain-containing protein [Bifidobacteriaceae bacterium]
MTDPVEPPASDPAEPPIAVDTSVAVPLLAVAHPDHEAVRSWAQGRDLRLCGHAIAETYSVLTRLRGRHFVPAAVARAAIDGAFDGTLALSTQAGEQVHGLLEAAGVEGGAVYDALVALAAKEHGLPLATRDARARSHYEVVGVEAILLAQGPSAEVG